MPPANYPEVLACLGLGVALYGILYLEVARVPEKGWLLVAVGLLGKVIAPVGLVALGWSGRWPLGALGFALANDLIWWPPFTLYLRDAWPEFRREFLWPT